MMIQQIPFERESHMDWMRRKGSEFRTGAMKLGFFMFLVGVVIYIKLCEFCVWLLPRSGESAQSFINPTQAASGDAGELVAQADANLQTSEPTRNSQSTQNSQPTQDFLYGENSDRLEQAGFTGFIPPSFICPLSQQIMTDPVFPVDTPSHRFEHLWILNHLERSQTNPLNRQSMTIEDLRSDEPLKASIKRFVGIVTKPIKTTDDLAFLESVSNSSLAELTAQHSKPLPNRLRKCAGG